MKGIDHVSNNPEASAAVVKRPTASAADAAHRDAGHAAGAPRDKVTLSTPPSVAALLYARPSGGATGAQDGVAQLKDLLLKSFQQQGLSTDIATGADTTASLADLTPDQAKALVAADGYWGVDQTSARVADLAMGLAGNDPAKAESVMKALEKGFGQAREAFGGHLPEISEKTIAAVRQKIEAWGATATAVG